MNVQSNVDSRDKEIDLIELVKVLWDKKIWILLSAVVGMTIAGIYAFTAKEQWTSKAEVIAPKLSDLGDYFTLRREYARILNGEVDTNGIASGLFGKFNQFTESLDKRREFLESSELYREVLDGKSELEIRNIISNLATKNIIITKPDAKKEPDLIGRRISLSAETGEFSQKALSEFINFNSKLAYQEDIDNFLIGFNELVKDLGYEKLKFERDLKIQKSVQLENLSKALSIAKEAGIKDYLKSVNNNNELVQNMVLTDTKVPLSDSKLSDGTYLFMLGEKYLKAQIDVVANSEIVYPPRYYLVTELLRELEPLLEKTQKAKAQAFSYQASPDYPVAKDKPKKALILGIGLFIGLILSSLVVLVLGFINRK